jgi:hypothetical protein
MAMKYSKGLGPVTAEYAKGGPEFSTRSKFMKTPDVFRTSIEEQDYGKKGKGGTLSKTEGETKKLPAIKPRS